jgi:hypothetical protein
MNHLALESFTENILRDAGFGLGVLACVLLFATVFFVRILIVFNKFCHDCKNCTSLKLTFFFMVAILLLCIVQVCSILIWSAALYFSGLITDLNLAMLFAGSCYTTLGIFTAHIQESWQSLTFYISFSGLFSFALATSCMMSMLSAINKKLAQLTY